MRRMLLIARREYLAYLSSWGFWVSLALVPVMIGAFGIGFPMLMRQSEPAKLIAVIADAPQDRAAVEQALADDMRAATRSALRGHAAALGGPPAETAALAAFDARPGLEGLADALAAAAKACRPSMAAQCAQTDAGFRRPDPQMILVPAPAADIEALRPYLSGASSIPGQSPSRGLHAAAFVTRDPATGARKIDYWSASLTAREARDLIERAVSRVQREEAFERAGVAADRLSAIEAERPTVTSLDPLRAPGADATVGWRDRMPTLAAFALAFTLWSVVFGVANMLLTSVIEEKSSKVLDTLLTSVRYEELLAGKLLGVAGVSATLMGVWGAMLGIGIAASASLGAPGGVTAFLSVVARPDLLALFAGLFICGYLMFGAMFLALGSLCETLNEAQTLMTPIIFLLMGPLLFMPLALEDARSQVLAAASWVPFFAPFLLLVRAPSEPSLWALAGPAAVMVVTALLCLWGASAVFRAGALGLLRADSLFKRRKATPG